MRVLILVGVLCFLGGYGLAQENLPNTNGEPDGVAAADDAPEAKAAPSGAHHHPPVKKCCPDGHCKKCFCHPLPKRCWTHEHVGVVTVIKPHYHHSYKSNYCYSGKCYKRRGLFRRWRY